MASFNGALQDDLGHCIMTVGADWSWDQFHGSKGIMNTSSPLKMSDMNQDIMSTTGLLEMSDICPGLDYMTMQNATSLAVQQINGVPTCHDNELPDYTAQPGVVYGVCGTATVYCRVHIQVAQGMFARAHFQRLAYWCDSKEWATYVYTIDYTITCSVHSLNDFYIDSSTNHMHFSHLNSPAVKITVEAVKERNLIVVHASVHSRHMTLPVHCFKSVDIWEELRTPPAHIFMLSFQCRELKFSKEGCVLLNLIYKQNNINGLQVKPVTVRYGTPAMVISTSYLVMNVQQVQPAPEQSTHLFFSFHGKADSPLKLFSGLFNCSVNQYSRFQHHLVCNLKTECEDGQDETEHCPFSSPGCQGLVASRNKCFQIFVSLNFAPRVSWMVIALHWSHNPSSLLSFEKVF